MGRQRDICAGDLSFHRFLPLCAQHEDHQVCGKISKDGKVLYGFLSYFCRGLADLCLMLMLCLLAADAPVSFSFPSELQFKDITTALKKKEKVV